MGASILTGISGAASVAGLFGPPEGANTPIFGETEKGVGIASESIGVGVALVHAGLISAASSFASFAALAGPIALGAAAVLVILSHVFHGADPLQVPASQTQQAFESAGDDLYLMAKGGFISKQEATDGINRLIEAGKIYFQELLDPTKSAQTARDPRPFERGRDRMIQTLMNEITDQTGVDGLDDLPLRSWDESGARDICLQPGLKGWYPNSLQAGQDLAIGYVSALRAASMPAAMAPSSLVPARASASVTRPDRSDQSFPGLAVAVALGIVVIFFFV